MYVYVFSFVWVSNGSDMFLCRRRRYLCFSIHNATTTFPSYPILLHTHTHTHTQSSSNLYHLLSPISSLHHHHHLHHLHHQLPELPQLPQLPGVDKKTAEKNRKKCVDPGDGPTATLPTGKHGNMNGNGKEGMSDGQMDKLTN